MFRNTGKKEEFKEVTSLNKGKYLIEFDYQPIIINDYDEEGKKIGEHEDPIFATWMQHTFNRKPDNKEIENLILGYYNDETDKKILNGFTWTSPNNIEVNVYLSSENQFNYKVAYDLAYQTNGQSLPFRLKFGTIENPQYYDFTTLEEFSNFYLSSINFVNITLQEGWNKKDSIDWSKYII